MSDPQKEARETAERRGVKAYEPPAETKQEPCECRVRQALEPFVKYADTRLLVFGESGRNGYHELIVDDGEHVAQVLRSDWDAARAAIADPCSCEQLRERAAELEMARDVAQDSAALWTKNAFTAVGELHASRSLLEEARLALHSFRLVNFRDVKRKLSVLAKIEAAQKPKEEL